MIFDHDKPEHSSDSGSSDSDGIADDDCLLSVDRESLEDDEELKVHIMGAASLYTSVIETNFASNVQRLPTRYLPPGSLRLLYEQFKLECPGTSCSYVHFWRTFRANWHHVLRFQAASTHGSCDACSGFKSAFRTATDAQTKFETARAYRAHINEVSKDRDLEQHLQSQAPLQRSGAPICVHVDSWLQQVSFVFFPRASSHSTKALRMEWTKANGGYLDITGRDRSSRLRCWRAHNSKFKAAGFTMSCWTFGSFGRLFQSLSDSCVHLLCG